MLGTLGKRGRVLDLAPHELQVYAPRQWPPNELQDAEVCNVHGAVALHPCGGQTSASKAGQAVQKVEVDRWTMPHRRTSLSCPGEKAAAGGQAVVSRVWLRVGRSKDKEVASKA